MAQPGYRAYIDESGRRARTPRSSPHFVMSAHALSVLGNDAPAETRIDICRAVAARSPGSVGSSQYPLSGRADGDFGCR